MPGAIVRHPAHADRWYHCSASPEWEAKFPREKNDVAREGDAMHEAVSMLLNPDAPIQDLVDRHMSNGITLDGYMMDAVNNVVEYVNGLGFPQQQLVVEGYLAPEGIPYPGKPDLWHLCATTATLDIIDFKFGYKPVEATPNWQMVAYAHLIIATLGKPISKIRMHICQPRAWHPLGSNRVWEIGFDELWTQYITPLYQASQRAAECVTGMHCGKCSAIGNCSASRESSLAALEIAMLPVYEDMDGDALGGQIDQMELAMTVVKHRLESLKGIAEYRQREGKAVTGWGTVSKLGNKQWNKECNEDFLKAFGEGIGVSFTDEKTITPAEAIRRGADESVIEQLTYRQSSTRLVKMTPEMIQERMNNGKRK